MFHEVQDMYLMSGSSDLTIRVTAPTMKEIFKFVWEKVAVLDGVTNTETRFVMRKYKQ